MAPEGSTCDQTFRIISAKIFEASNGQVEFKLFPSGSKGDEAQALNKIKSGQIQGGLFTGQTLGEINGDARIFELPFLMEKHTQIPPELLEKFLPIINNKFEKKGFKNLGIFEIGHVYYISNNEFDVFDSSLKLKSPLNVWVWKNDLLSEIIVKNFHLNPMFLELGEVIPSLKQNKIHATYAPPVVILGLQWQTLTKYLISTPLSYYIGCFLIDLKSWETIPRSLRNQIQDIVASSLKDASKKAYQENKEALQLIKDGGMKFIEHKEINGHLIQKIVFDQIKNKYNLFSENILELIQKYLN